MAAGILGPLGAMLGFAANSHDAGQARAQQAKIDQLRALGLEDDHAKAVYDLQKAQTTDLDKQRKQINFAAYLANQRVKSTDPREKSLLDALIAELANGTSDPDTVAGDYNKFLSQKPEKESAKPFRPYTTASGVQAFEGYAPNGTPIITRLGDAPVRGTSASQSSVKKLPPPVYAQIRKDHPGATDSDIGANFGDWVTDAYEKFTTGKATAATAAAVSKESALAPIKAGAAAARTTAVGEATEAEKAKNAPAEAARAAARTTATTTAAENVKAAFAGGKKPLTLDVAGWRLTPNAATGLWGVLGESKGPPTGMTAMFGGGKPDPAQRMVLAAQSTQSAGFEVRKTGNPMLHLPTDIYYAKDRSGKVYQLTPDGSAWVPIHG